MGYLQFDNTNTRAGRVANRKLVSVIYTKSFDTIIAVLWALRNFQFLVNTLADYVFN